jgi:Kef-type K+ transport system membrane component KefB
MLLVQLLVILLASRLAAWLLRWLGQPAVVGGAMMTTPMLLYFTRPQRAGATLTRRRA